MVIIAPPVGRWQAASSGMLRALGSSLAGDALAEPHTAGILGGMGRVNESRLPGSTLLAVAACVQRRNAAAEWPSVWLAWVAIMPYITGMCGCRSAGETADVTSAVWHKFRDSRSHRLEACRTTRRQGALIMEIRSVAGSTPCDSGYGQGGVTVYETQY